MVRVPNFAGLNSATANSQLASAGLALDPLSREIATNISSQNGISLGQFPAAGTLVDYETPIIINFGKFVADTVTVSGCQGYTTPVNDPDYCSGTLYVYGPTRTKNRKTVTTTNNVTGAVSISYDYSCADTVVDRGSAYLDGNCGYVTPPVTCTYSINYGSWSACNAAFQVYSSGTQSRTVSGTNTDCSSFSYTETTTCWQAVCGAWTDWGAHPTDSFKQRRARLCQKTDGTRYTETEDRCKTSSTTTYSTCINKKRTATTKNYSCGKLVSTTYEYNLPCTAL